MQRIHKKLHHSIVLLKNSRFFLASFFTACERKLLSSFFFHFGYKMYVTYFAKIKALIFPSNTLNEQRFATIKGKFYLKFMDQNLIINVIAAGSTCTFESSVCSVRVPSNFNSPQVLQCVVCLKNQCTRFHTFIRNVHVHIFFPFACYCSI